MLLRCIQQENWYYLHFTLPTQQFASVGDDTVITVWHFKEKKDLSVLTTMVVTNSAMVGVQFCGESSNLVASVGYDTALIHTILV
jgi:WD40 repeat protein